FLHRRLFVAVTDDLECLHHGNARRHHSRELTRKYGNVLKRGFSPPHSSALRLDACSCNPLSSKVGTQCRFIGGKSFPTDFVATLVFAFPDKLNFLLACGCCCRHKIRPLRSSYSIVTLFTSSKLVTPSFTFCKPD